MDNEKIEINKKDLICAICKEPFIEPVFIPSCGHHSCRECLIQLINSDIDNNRKCSICLVPFDNLMTIDYLNTVKSNFMLSNLVNEHFSIKCENYGCEHKHLESHQENHNKKCPYFIINCKNKNNGCHDTFIRKDEFNHLNVCRYHTCVGKRYGCNYKNTLDELDIHQKDCIYRKIGRNVENKLIENVTCYVEEKINEVNENHEKKEKDMSLRIKSLERSLSSLRRKVGMINTYNYSPLNYRSEETLHATENPHTTIPYLEQPPLRVPNSQEEYNEEILHPVNNNDYSQINNNINDNTTNSNLNTSISDNLNNNINNTSISSTINPINDINRLSFQISRNNQNIHPRTTFNLSGRNLGRSLNNINRSNLVNSISQILESDINRIIRNDVNNLLYSNPLEDPNNNINSNINNNYNTFNNEDESENM